MQKNALNILLIILFAIALVLPVRAGVTAQEAQRLGKDLTPFGAVRAGNADGTIPAWEGGLTQAPEGVTYNPASGDHLPNPFAREKALYTITAQNIAQYADKLTEGQIALLKKYPDTYKLHVYPSHRTVAAPQWVYDNTARNAVNASLTKDGEGVTGAYGGIAFPFAQKGAEAIFNHTTRWNGGDGIETYNVELVHADGSRTTGGGGAYLRDRPYYAEEGSAETWSGWQENFLIEYQVPARRKGEILLVMEPLNFSEQGRAAWQYIPGQRRIRRAPSVAYDTPNPTFGGLATYDDAFMFNGAIDRYNWKLKGKKELIIPYHNYDLELAALDQLLTPRHINPESVRWELHRVWVVEASLKKGSRHAYGKRVMYLDEDSWFNLLEDKYDTRGKLWRTAVGHSIMDWTVPALLQSTAILYDLQRRDYAADRLFNEIQGARKFTPISADRFTPQNVRKLGKR